ncbi:hypothetical protein BDC45DRAFT_568256 [Circinella umbellata]|nr:hypothetical protein BDC45DRAFT_568256 [Circinella umbellata]
MKYSTTTILFACLLVLSASYSGIAQQQSTSNGEPSDSTTDSSGNEENVNVLVNN